MKVLRFVLAATLLLAACNGDEQEQDVGAVEHETPTPMPASAPADTVGGADTTTVTGDTTGLARDTAAHTTTH